MGAADQYSKLHIDFTDDGTLKVITAGTVSLQKQVRALKQELSVATPENQQQIRVLLSQAELGLERTKAQSKELFGQLALLPGPMGRFAGEAQMGYLALRTLSQLSFKDIITDFKIMGQTLFGIQNSTNLFYGKDAQLGNISNTGNNALAAGAGAGLGAGIAGGNKKPVTPTGGVTQSIGGNVDFNKQYQDFLELNSKIEAQADKSLEFESAITNQRTNLSSARISQLQKEGYVYYENIVKYQKATDAYGETFNANRKLADAAKNLSTQFTDLGVVIDDGSLKISRNDEALRTLSKEELAAVNSGKQLILTEDGLIVATTAFGTALRSVGAVLAGVLTTVAELLPLLLAIAGIMKAGEWFIEWITGAKEAEIANNKLIDSIKGVQERLELSSGTEKNTAEKRLAALKANQTDEKTLREQGIKDQKEQLKILENSISESVTNQNKAISNLDKFSYKIDESGKYKTTKFFGIGQDEIDKAVKTLEDANKVVTGLYIKRGEKITEINKLQGDNTSTIIKNKQQDDLRELDANIQKEINSENTSSVNLLKLYKQRNDMVDAENRKRNIYLGSEEEKQRTKQQAKTALEEEVKDKVAAIDRLIQIQKNSENETTKGTKEYFASRREQIALELDKELEQAKTSEKHKDELIKDARSKNYKENFDLDKEELTAKIELANLAFQNEDANTQEAFKKRIDLENSQYKLKQKNAQGNYEILEQLAIDHQNKLDDIENDKLKYRASVEQKIGDVTNDQQKKHFEELRAAEEDNYKAQKVDAGDNAQELEIIELEHAQKLRDIKEQEFEAGKKFQIAIVETTKQFGGALSTIGDAMMQDAQGRDKAKFEQGKKLAVAGIAVEKAASIGLIWENNAIANAKATATFWETSGQPWVTINTIQAAISTAATIAAAASAISQINGTDFNSNGADTINRGKNYGYGGMIDGPSHANGGVPATLEGGEAVMTRGAVTAFAPLLSLMNQAGGGTAFSQAAMGQAKWDNPKTQNGPNEPQIIKTYIVENELTSIQQRQARLKSLSTL